MSSKNTAYTPLNSAIVLIDHQPGVLKMVKSLPAEVVSGNAATLARLGDQMGIPLVITSTRENLEFLGTTLPAVQKAAPKAYELRIRRPGTLNAFAHKPFADAVKHTDRRNLIMAGILTDVCLWHAAAAAIEAGYNVRVVADANGTSTVLGDLVTYDRLRDLGVVVTTTNGVLFELYPDLATAEGLRAEAVAAAAAAPT
jgi:nicotinamidase-related amidase